MEARLEQLKKQAEGQFWANRILSELTYLYRLLGNQEALHASAVRLSTLLAENGCITKQDVVSEEQTLSGFHTPAKSLSLVCVAHAHIDMNWMWAMPETVGVVIDTFQTMLDLMAAYPAFTFTQSQASTYEIVERFAPSMLPAIRQRIHEGRWEVAATHWVEPDKNMICTESMARHLLYTKQYLSRLLEIDPSSLTLDFEPDTFGHPRGVPEVLCHAGVKYMYHCRGNENEEIYRWRAPSGAEMLVYREPNWYNTAIEPQMAAFLPAFCKRNHVNAALQVYGVGDHGGGPTRRDIERILDMQTWPLMPQIRFGRFDKYFRSIEPNQAVFPVVDRELNFVFTGCYTSQARIKRANRIGEDHLYDSEAMLSMARLAGCEPKPSADFAKAWQNVLFCQFHDILPGSGVRDTREYALGLFQETDSIATGNMNRAMQAIAHEVDTSALGIPPGVQKSTAEGAGAGHGVFVGAKLEHNGFTQRANVSDVSRGSGDIRAFVVFNPTQYARSERVWLTLWDWDLSLQQTSVYSANRKELPFDILEQDMQYWSHRYATLAFLVEAPAFGYTTVFVARAQTWHPAPYEENMRVQHLGKGNPALENDFVRAEFDRRSLMLVSLIDKRANRELLRAPAGFRLIEEENVGFFTAWEIGRYGKTINLQEENFVRLSSEQPDGVFGRLSFTFSFGSSALSVRVTLDGDLLRFSVEADWRETGEDDKPIPQLQFIVPYAYHADCIRYDSAVGPIDRPESNHDVPALLYAAPVQTGGGFMLMTDSKYGYRATDHALSVSLIRSPHSPDKLPDMGVHTMELGLATVTDFTSSTLDRRAFCFAHPLYVRSASTSKGSLPQTASLLSVTGNARITALKPAEDGKKLLLRCYQNTNEKEMLTIAPVAEAMATDILENAVAPLPVRDGKTAASLPPHTLCSLCILPETNKE